jgi:heme exporter protein B
VSPALAALFRRDLRMARRIGGGGAMGVVFFLILVTIAPFAIGPDLSLLGRIGPALMWIAALLATLLGLDRLFQADYEDGSLDVLLTADVPTELLVATKCLAHWVTTGLPLVVASPLLGLMLAVDPPGLSRVAATLLVGTPALTFIGAIGAALTASLRRGGLLMPILVLPLCVPTLIFGVSAATATGGAGMTFATPFLILCGLTLFAMAASPFAAAAALEQMDA